MRIGFYMNTDLVYVFGIISSDNLPFCGKCHAFHYEGYRCATPEDKEAVAHQVKETANKVTAEEIIRDAYGVPNRGLLRGWGQDRFGDLVAKLL